MSNRNRIELRISEIRTELRRIAEAEELTPEIREQLPKLKQELTDLETKLQAAILAEDQSDDPVAPGETVDPETRERQELRSKVSLAGFFQGAAGGRYGAEYKEYAAACKADPNSIPLDLFEDDTPETRAVTPAPASGTGVNINKIVPAIFSMSIAGSMIDMPRVPSGTSSWLRITTSQSAGFEAKGDSRAATAGALTATSTTPKRISARLEILMEAAAEVGAANFESALRMNLQQVLSNELDKALLSGDGTGNNISGLITGVGSPTAETTTETWALARAKVVGLTDGIFARKLSDVTLLTNVATMQTFDGLFPATTAGVVPRESLSMQLSSLLQGYMSSANMPPAASNVATAIACRKGTSEQLAVSPIWSDVAITDVYSGSASGLTSFNLHILVGSVLVLQPGGFATLSFKLA